MKTIINKIVSLIIINGCNFYSNPMEAVVDNSSENIIKENNLNIEKNVIAENNMVTVDEKKEIIETNNVVIEANDNNIIKSHSLNNIKTIKFYHKFPKFIETIFFIITNGISFFICERNLRHDDQKIILFILLSYFIYFKIYLHLHKELYKFEDSKNKTFWQNWLPTIIFIIINIVLILSFNTYCMGCEYSVYKALDSVSIELNAFNDRVLNQCNALNQLNNNVSYLNWILSQNNQTSC